jgi:hypothetical protein
VINVLEACADELTKIAISTQWVDRMVRSGVAKRLAARGSAGRESVNLFAHRNREAASDLLAPHTSARVPRPLAADSDVARRAANRHVAARAAAQGLQGKTSPDWLMRSAESGASYRSSGPAYQRQSLQQYRKAKLQDMLRPGQPVRKAQNAAVMWGASNRALKNPAPFKPQMAPAAPVKAPAPAPTSPAPTPTSNKPAWLK